MSKQRHPEEDVLSADEHKIVEGGREALRSLGRRTFDHWMAVGRGIKVLRAKADRLGGTKTFRRLLARHGFDSLDNSVISKLLKPSPRRRGLARNSLREAAGRVVGSEHALPALPDLLEAESPVRAVVESKPPPLILPNLVLAPMLVAQYAFGRAPLLEFFCAGRFSRYHPEPC